MNNDYTLDLNAIINSHSSWALNKQLATKLSLVPNFSVGSFFSSLDDTDIVFLSKEVSETNYEDNAAAELFLMLVLLMTAEGLDISDDEKLTEKFEILLMFISLESLHRKNLVKLNHEHMTFGDDMNHTTLVEATDDGMRLMAELLKQDQK